MIFTVIIPSYNHDNFLKKRIESVLDQTYANFEVIILDDASTDNSRKIIEQYRHHPKVSLIVYNEQNSGSPFKQWKKGIELAKGEWIWIAESDDYAELNFLETAVNEIKNKSTLNLYFCDSRIMDENNNELNESFSMKKNKLFNTSKWSNSFIANGKTEINEHLKFICINNNISSAIFRKKSAQYFLNELAQYRYHGDWFFYIKICEENDYLYNNQLHNHFRHHRGSLLSSGLNGVIARREKFIILSYIYSLPYVQNKEKVLNFFTLYYLSFGILEIGFSNSFKIIRTYFNINSSLALKVIAKLFWIKILRKNINEF